MSPAEASSEDVPAASGRLTLLAPTPALTITIEPGTADDPEAHIHADGQGFGLGGWPA